MALLDPAHPLATVRRDRTTAKRGIHPSICLVSGFGFILATGLLVHMAFQAIF